MPPRFRSHHYGAAPHQFRATEIPRPTITLIQQRELVARAAQKLGRTSISIGHAAAAMGLGQERALEYFQAEAMQSAAEFASKGNKPSMEYVGVRVSGHLADYDRYRRTQRSRR